MLISLSGGNHVFCVTTTGDMYSWGTNNFGQLATEDYEEHNQPFTNSEWPDNIVHIKVGDSRTLVLTSNHEVYSYGNNNSFQLGRDTGVHFNSSEFKKN